MTGTAFVTRRDVLLAVAAAIALVLDCALNTHASGPLWSDAIFYGLAGLSLAWRRRFPVPTLLVSLGFLALGTAAGTDAPDLNVSLLFLVLPTVAVGHDAEGAWAWVGLALGLVMVGVVTALSAQSVSLDSLGFPLGVMVAAFACGRLLRNRLQLNRALADEAARLELDREARARAAVGEERARIAREMHDVVAHTMAIMVVQAGAARRVLDRDPAAAEQALATVEDTGRVALGELRRLLGFLRDDDDAGGAREPQPTLASVDKLVDRAREAGLRVALDVEGDEGELPPGAELAAYRIVQEALTNTLKHAGPGTAVAVRLAWTPAALAIEVADRGGTGGTGEGSGHGLVGMRERAAVHGGTLSAGPRPGGGFVVRATLPRSEVLA